MYMCLMDWFDFLSLILYIDSLLLVPMKTVYNGQRKKAYTFILLFVFDFHENDDLEFGICFNYKKL